MKIIQLAHQTYSQMLGYILVTPDGSLCCIDGGMTSDAEHLLQMLKTLGGEKPRVKYWFLTLAHLDHCDAFLALYPRKGIDFELDHLVYAFPSCEDADRYEPEYSETVHLFEALQPKEHILPNAGDIFDLGGGAVMEVLQTWTFGETFSFLCNAGTVYRLRGEGKTAIFLGDLGVTGGRRLLNRYGYGLKCDIVQMAHHGQSGVERAVYEAMQPDICLWSTPDWLWSNTPDPLHPGCGPWATPETFRWMQEIGAQWHLIAKDGTWEMDITAGQVHFARLDRHTGEMA